MASTAISLRALADPTRLRLLALLAPDELSVAEIQEILGMGQSRISTHLAQLKRAGLVRDRRSGKHSYYGVIPGPTWKLLEPLVRAAVAETPEAARDTTAVRLLLRRRRDTTREYFNQLAGRFGRSYVPGRTWKGLSHLLLELLPPLDIADLGAGEGTLSQLLARSAKSVVAVDNSEKMVAFGLKLIRDHRITNLEYRLGDIEDPPIPATSIDLALFSQALHHAVHPAKAVEAAFGILRPGGRIAILDLLGHTFEEARKLYADQWLGFGEAELHELLEQAGFQNIRVDVVARESRSPNFQTVLALGRKS